MSKIDEIMGAVGRHGDDCIRDADAALASFEGLRDLIAAALTDAERKGAAASVERISFEVHPIAERERQCCGSLVTGPHKMGCDYKMR